jgi:hypothetical protein
MMAKSKRESTRKYISHYLTQLRNVRISLRGDDLKTLGIPPGPRYRKLLSELMDARLDGEVKTREDEVEYVKRTLKLFRLPPRHPRPEDTRPFPTSPIFSESSRLFCSRDDGSHERSFPC